MYMIEIWVKMLTRFKEDWIDGMFAPVVGQT
jgi:hypothetical protein